MRIPKFLNHWLVPCILIGLGMGELISSIFQRPPIIGWPGWLLLGAGLVLGHLTSEDKNSWLVPCILIGIGMTEPITLIFNDPIRIGWPAWFFLVGGLVLGCLTPKYKKQNSPQTV